MPLHQHRLQALAGCGDAERLRAAVLELCAEFGKVANIDIVTMAQAERRRAVCLLRLESATQERELIATLGLSRFGEDVLVVVDL